MHSGAGRYRRKVRTIRRSRQLANCHGLLDTAVVTVSRKQLRTADYTDQARARLADAVTKARTAASYPFRTDLVIAAKAAGEKLSLRSLQAVESGESGVGQAVLFALGRLLPNWTEDTPRIILEGGPIPPTMRTPVDAPTDPLGVGVPFRSDEELIAMSAEQLARYYVQIDRAHGREAADDTVFRALTVRRDAARRRRDTLAIDDA